MSMNNQKIWIVIGVLAVVIGGVAFLGNDFPSGSDEVSGTIVPAERYRGEQLSSDDVVLGDESVAQFMQTDAFESMINDPKLVAILADPEVQAALSNADFANLMANADFANLMANADFANLMANADFAKAMSNADVQAAFNKAAHAER